MKNPLLVLKAKANEIWNEEVQSFTYPEKNCLKITFESSEFAEEFVNFNEFQKNSKGTFIFRDVDFEQDNDAVYLTYIG